MIYAPAEVYDLRLALASGIIAATEQAAIDFIAGENKPWAYYVGVGFGGAAAATGIEGAAATLYVVGDTVNILFFHSPQGSDVDLFLDGILSQTFSTYDDDEGWVGHAFTISALAYSRLDFVNGPPASGNSSGISWLGIDTSEVTGGMALQRGQNFMALVTFSYSIQDADGHKKSILVQAPYVAQTLANLVTAAQTLAGYIDDVIDGAITEIHTEVGVALPGGVKTTPNADCDVEHGGLVTFNASGTPYVWSLFLPTILDSVLAGDNLPNTGDVATLTAALIDGIGTSGAQVAYSDRYGNDLVAFKSGRESFRK
jgi:hypothetical protein